MKITITIIILIILTTNNNNNNDNNNEKKPNTSTHQGRFFFFFGKVRLHFRTFLDTEMVKIDRGLSRMFNTMTADDLATQGAKSSTAMAFT